MLRNWVAIGLASGGALLSADVTHTERVDLSAGGTLRLEHSFGEVTIEGWDRPEAEIATIKSPKAGADTGDLAKVRIEVQKQGGDVVVQTRSSRRAESRVRLEYRIHVPAGAKLAVAHEAGEIHLRGVTADIRATIGHGLITLNLPKKDSFAIDARTALGAVISDVPGDVKRLRLLGHRLVQTPPAPYRQVYLRSGFGDIVILRAATPSGS
jgi:hypothetical protein